MSEEAVKEIPSLGCEKTIAALLLSIDPELAAKVVKHLTDDGLDTVTRAMKELQELAVDRMTISRVMRDTVVRLRKGGVALGDVSASMDTMLTRAFGPDKADEIGKRASGDILARRPFAMFESLTAEDLANLLMEEHPQIAAVFLAHLDRSKGGQVLNYLTDEQKADLMFRVATLDRTPPEVVQRVLEVMRRKVKDLGLTTLRSEPRAWVKAAAQILNNMGGGEKTILEEISKSDQKISQDIREEMFTFDDVAGLDKKSMQKILGQVETRALALALKAVIPAVEENILGNLSKRAADMVAEERDSLGPTPLSDVLESQQEILVAIRELMDSGDIAAGAAGEELV